MSKLLSLAALAPLVQLAAAGVWLGGINIAGFDFGCPNTDGTYYADLVDPPLTSQSGVDGAGQMQHFVDDDGFNVFRLPVCWQYLVDELGGELDTTHAGIYDELVGACLSTGAYCVIDVHNYARWNGEIIGQSNGAVTNDQFASLWYNIAYKYKDEAKVIFGVMNEPHDLDITEWATSVQYAVTSIREAGATSQMILLPGSNYTAVGDFENQGSAAALATVNNGIDTTTTNLIFDVHQYLDEDYSGTHDTCVYNGVDNLNSLASWLSSNNRQAFLTETGGGSTDSCDMYLCAELDSMNYQSSVYLGWIGWAAGSFSATTYALTETPTESGSTWTDQDIVTKCVKGKFNSS